MFSSADGTVMFYSMNLMRLPVSLAAKTSTVAMMTYWSRRWWTISSSSSIHLLPCWHDNIIIPPSTEPRLTPPLRLNSRQNRNVFGGDDPDANCDVSFWRIFSRLRSWRKKIWQLTLKNAAVVKFFYQPPSAETLFLWALLGAKLGELCALCRGP